MNEPTAGRLPPRFEPILLGKAGETYCDVRGHTYVELKAYRRRRDYHLVIEWGVCGVSDLAPEEDRWHRDEYCADCLRVLEFEVLRLLPEARKSPDMLRYIRTVFVRARDNDDES